MTMKDLQFSCTQKCARFEDGWDHPESIEEATDQYGNLYNCCECDCDDNCCQECDDGTDEGCPCNECCDDGGNEGNDETGNAGNLVCSVFEKTCTCEESRGPSNVNDDTGWHKSCTTSIRIVKKYQRT